MDGNGAGDAGSFVHVRGLSIEAAVPPHGVAAVVWILLDQSLTSGPKALQL